MLDRAQPPSLCRGPGGGAADWEPWAHRMTELSRRAYALVTRGTRNGPNGVGMVTPSGLFTRRSPVQRGPSTLAAYRLRPYGGNLAGTSLSQLEEFR
ncbi:hypothetical protein GCM10022247_23990 [Allokutzneria multivorans]|uniref:Uncharacterized protein n=1 Tax=Allokutzneria multivorans TaxID=1142134 RepID=A0ABP7RUS3_9PSEU